MIAREWILYSQNEIVIHYLGCFQLHILAEKLAPFDKINVSLKPQTSLIRT